MVYLHLKTRTNGIIVGVKIKYANHNPKPYNLSPLNNSPYLYTYMRLYNARSIVQGSMNKNLKLHGCNIMQVILWCINFKGSPCYNLV